MIGRGQKVPGADRLAPLCEFVDEEDGEDHEEGRWLAVDPLGSREAYRDMERFTATFEGANLVELPEVALDGPRCLRSLQVGAGLACARGARALVSVQQRQEPGASASTALITRLSTESGPARC